MDQDAWNQIYNDLENDVEAQTTRGADRNDATIFLQIDRARFAIDKGDNAAAIALIQDLKQRLSARGGGAATTRGATALPSVERLDALEDILHGEQRMGSARLEIVGEDEEEEALTRNASQNTKVKKSIKYEDIGDELAHMFDTARIREEKRDAVRSEANRVIANRAVYEKIESDTKVPWWFIGLIHGMECSFSLNKHLHNGDSLKARTWQVPAGRPKKGSPPFTFHDSAVDALETDGFAGKTDWQLSMVLYRLERYNGFGYRRKFGTASPYLWSYTNHFTSGKYVKDGVYDPNATSKQCGAAAMLRDLMERGVVSFDAVGDSAGAAVAAAPAAKPTPEPAPKPVVVAAPAPQPPAATQPPAAPTPVVVAAPAPAAVAAPKPVEPTTSPPAPASAAAAASATAPQAPSAPAATVPGPTAAAPSAAPAAALPSGLSPAVASALSALAAATKPAAAADKPTEAADQVADASRGPRK